MRASTETIQSCFVKAILDLILILLLTASYGKGCLFSALPVGIWQGLGTVLSI